MVQHSVIFNLIHILDLFRSWTFFKAAHQLATGQIFFWIEFETVNQASRAGALS